MSAGEVNWKDLEDAFRFMAEQQIFNGQHAVSRTTQDAPLDMLKSHYQAQAFYRAASLVSSWQSGRGEPMGPTVEVMADAYRKHHQ